MKGRMSRAIEDHRVLVGALAERQLDVLQAAADLLVACLREGGKVLLCGNGGSAADAQHIAGELVGRFQRERKALAAIALTTDTSVMTAWANDYDFEGVFARQVEGLLRAGDVLWAFSTSGRSANVLAAAERARSMGGRILAFTGRAGRPLEGLADVCLAVETDCTARVQEVHQLAYHILCDLVETALSTND